MRHLAATTAVLGLVSLPTGAQAEPIERPTITVMMKGNDLEVVVHNVSDYCTTNAATRIVRTSDAIRIQRDRPSKVSRCLDTRDLTFTVPNITAGRYAISYERIPAVAPIRWIQVASTTTLIE